MSEIEKRLVSYLMLAQMHQRSLEPQKPEQTELRLVNDGWEMWGGEIDQPIPVSVEMAYEASGFDQRVLDKTRQLCGDLRAKARRSPATREQLEDLRASLAKAREVKAQHESAACSSTQEPTP